ncbi:MAG: Homoserine O-acetyltransferase [Caulobacteraceae bacterium]|nr:Homoserine O-acetyltransferase [Caulobacteraceae bacterium]
MRVALGALGLAAALLFTGPSDAQTMGGAPERASGPKTWPTHDGVFDIANFKFKDGNTLPVLHLHYLTLGSPHRDAQGHVDNAVLLLHGTGGDAHSLMAPQFSDVLFGPGQPLDITRYFLILPDDIGHGQSSKPSDGLHMRFPAYTYDDMVASQHAMLAQGLHVDRLRLILGTSMGCMQTFVWGETYPGFADALAPFACLPIPIAGRNRMMRYMSIEAIERDPAWENGDYKSEPVLGLRNAAEMIFIMGSSPLQMQKNFPTREAAERRVDSYLDHAVATTDANDMIYYVNASRDYDPSAKLATITAPVLWINSADDFINPPELGIAEKLVNRMRSAKFILIPISDATRGHGTHTQAAVWKDDLADFLKRTERNQVARR